MPKNVNITSDIHRLGSLETEVMRRSVRRREKQKAEKITIINKGDAKRRRRGESREVARSG